MSDPGAAEASEWKPKGNPWLIALVITLAAFMEVLDTTIVNVALPHIAGSLSASNDDATWTLTSYLVANGIVLAISGWFGRWLGRKRYFMICIGMFTVFSLLCGLSTNLSQLILFRLAQGFFGGGLQPNQQAIIIDTFPPNKRATAFAFTTIATVVAPVVGPTLGGWITDNYSWRWIFFINVPIGALALFGTMNLVEDPPWAKIHKLHGFDVIGLGLITLGLGCLQITMDRGEDADWFSSTFIRSFAALAAIGLFGAVAWLLYAKNPIIDIRVLKDRNLAISCVLMIAVAAILYASAVVIPMLAQQELGYTATLAGLILSPGAVLICCLIPLASVAQRVIPTKYVIAFGLVSMGVAMIYSHGLSPDIDFTTLASMRCAQAFGLAFIFAPLTTIAFAEISGEASGDATALFTLCRNIAGSVGISLATATITNRTQVQLAYLDQHLGPLNPGYRYYLQRVTEGLASDRSAGASPTGTIFQMFREQGAVLAYLDIFYYCAILSFCAAPLALLLSGVKAGGGNAKA